MDYAELHCLSNFSFLRGASHPEELVKAAIEQGYRALALTDECSVSGVVRAHREAKGQLQLIVGSEFCLEDAPFLLVLLAPDRQAYGQLCRLITIARRRAPKGKYHLYLEDLQAASLTHCLALFRPQGAFEAKSQQGELLQAIFPQRLWLLGERFLENGEETELEALKALAIRLDLPIVAAGDVHMHSSNRQPLQDLVTAIRHGCTIHNAGYRLFSNAERHIRSLTKLERLYPPEWLAESIAIAQRCRFSLEELRYEYPAELVPNGHDAPTYLRALVEKGAQHRFHNKVPDRVRQQIEHELALIRELQYEHYFLTIQDIVAYARSQDILCQGRGSAANSVICYCLGITEVNPTKVDLLFERFISRNRGEPPDIDVDFEHERREEVIQYIYRKYGRSRAALAATIISYRARSAIRDAGKALGFDLAHIEQVLSGISWRDGTRVGLEQIREAGLTDNPQLGRYFITLVETLIGFPRHLSQHVGGFVISAGPIDELVPVENAAMQGRTVIQWDKDDLETLGLLKVDILALGMLTAIRKTLHLIQQYQPGIATLQDIGEEDRAVYKMLQRGDSIGVFQVESRAQINMLPRLKPEKYYDLVIQIAIVRPGPIQGDMVHPYLRRRDKIEQPDIRKELEPVLGRTLGVPIFQEQVIRLAMVAAGFSADEADMLRRAMAAWKRQGDLEPFRFKLIDGMLARGYTQEYAEQIYNQIRGFGGYGFPESHSASFALLAYVSAWLKYHHPAAFFCGLLNSQPMGFYSPSQLIQDARRHGVEVLPVDVNLSFREHSLTWPDKSPEGSPAIRLGFRLVKGLSIPGSQAIEANRPAEGFKDSRQLKYLTGLNNTDLEALASANALSAIAGHRYQARWDILGHDKPAPLLPPETRTQPAVGIQLPEPNEGETLLEDYTSMGLSLGRHPLALLRERGLLRRILTAEELQTQEHGHVVQVAGLVTGRQRPGSASGVTFVTLEDETGNINVVVWAVTAQQQRKALLTSRLLQVSGIMERRDTVIHIIAGRLTNLTHLIEGLTIPSRDFR
ncbi:error-prone DNA polymerase [Mangrovitalea sediminis]|uniref:error-prone DNA polymerase n=1 Tax=Mangrovitalea sediminis TaxID=1982043 RepID=UPI000BE4CDBB|nr:error-prone DNA polymerase [Mangrovitalea sediminis]